MKEEILKEFSKQDFTIGMPLDKCFEIQTFLSQAIAKTREETIKEVIEEVRDLDIFGYPAIEKKEFKEITEGILNKLNK